MEWPLTGRAGLMRRLGAALEGGIAGGLAIVGREGVGKSRVAAELRSVALAGGRAVESISASASARQIPFGAVSHLLTLPHQSPDRSLLMASLLPEFERRANELGAPVLFVDDAHHLDAQSAALIHQLAQRRLAVLVLTERLGEPKPDALLELWKDGLIHRFEVAPLTREASRQLVEAALGGPVDELTHSQLWQRSAGYPLFLRELVLGGLESGALTLINGQWHAGPQLAPSNRLSEIVGTRLGRLSAPQRDAVEALAVAHAVDLGWLEQITGGRNVVEDLEEKELIEVDQAVNRNVIRFAHPIYGEVLEAAMPRTRARAVRRRLADLLAATGARRHDDLLQLALWRLEGGGPIDPDLMLAAARRSLGVFDAVLAERLARAALAAGRCDVDVYQTLGQALADQQRVDEANETLVDAEQLAVTDSAIAQVALARANLLYFRAGQPADATAVLERALERVSDAGWRDEIESMQILFRSAAGQLRAVAEAGRRVTRRKDARPRTLVHVLAFSSIANVMLGRFAEAENHMRVGLEHAPAASDELPLMGEMLRINGVMAQAYAGRPAPASELARAGQQAALDAGSAEVASMWGMNLAECHILAGNIEAALHEMLGALVIVRERDPFSVRGIDAAVASMCASWLGRHHLASELEREVIDLQLARDVRSRIWLDRAQVWTTWSTAGQQSAAAIALDAGRRAVADTHLVWASFLFHDAARLGQAHTAAERLDGLASKIEGDFAPALAAHARALADGDAVGLERAASAFDQLGSSLYAAEAAAQAHHVYQRKGRSRLARVAASRASLLAARCPGVRTPALSDVAPVPLTSREIEIARLAADGMSSRELAQLLEISVRTVDNHLGTIYSKLGIGGRAELPAVMGVEALVQPE